MIHQYKSNLCSRPVPAVEFDNFLKARYEKQIIIQSDSQPISSKVQNFYELLKLSKSGSAIYNQSGKKHQSTILKNKSQSAKTINTFSQNNNNQYDFNRFEDIESDEAQMKKLNRMVYGLSEWEEDKERLSLHVGDKKTNQNNKLASHHDKKKAQTNYVVKQQLPQRKIKQRKQLAYSSCDGKRFRNFYAPLKKHQARAQLNKINSQFTKTSPQINYPQSLLNCNFLTKDPHHFKELKSKIKMFQDKAKNQYGMDFDNKQNSPSIIMKKSSISKNNFNDDYDSQQKQNDQQLTFSDLELGPILIKEDQLKSIFQSNKSGHKQNVLDDASIPKGLIDVVLQNKNDAFSRIMSGSNSQGLFDSPAQNKAKLKKGYLSRPRTFKPSYMYVQI